MKIVPVLAALLAAGSLAAQESGNLDARIQVFADVVQPREFTYSGGSNTQAERQVGLGFRILGELPYTTGWYYELGGRFDSSSALKLKNTQVDATDIKVSYSYWSAGVAYLWHMGPTAFGLHLEGRGEALSLRGEEYKPDAGGKFVSAGKVSTSSTYLRPWMRASLDVTLGSGKVRPFIGGEAAMALTRTSQTREISPTVVADDRTLKSMAPNVSFAGYVGLRF